MATTSPAASQRSAASAVHVARVLACDATGFNAISVDGEPEAGRVAAGVRAGGVVMGLGAVTAWTGATDVADAGAVARGAEDDAGRVAVAWVVVDGARVEAVDAGDCAGDAARTAAATSTRPAP